jgi:uncharacterized membrane protein
MSFKNTFKEFKAGLNKTSKYILSHHEPKEYYKCYSLKIKDKTLHFCSRCLGIYLGIILGIILYYNRIFNEQNYYLAIFIFPIFTLIDWTITAFTKYRSHNLIRTGFGVLLGVAYSFGLILFFKTFPNYLLIFIGFFYVIISFFLIMKQRGLYRK